MKRISGLDGLRAIAVLAVMAFHAGDAHLGGGYLGVDMFFALSGFLITTILLQDFEHTHRVDLVRFYVRRARRLFPALAAVLITITIAIAVLPHEPWSRPTLLGIPWTILYAANWRRAFTTDPNAMGLLAHTWSLSIEEQFYLLWPLVFPFLARRRNTRAISLVLVLGALGVAVWRAVLLHSYGSFAGYRVGNGLDTHADGLLIGCALAFLLASRPRLGATSMWLPVGGTLAMLGLVALLIGENEYGASGSEIGYLSAAALTALIIWSLTVNAWRPLRHALDCRAMRFIGARSYGLYLWHYPVFVALAPHVTGRSGTLLEVLISFSAAVLSYRYIEQPFLRRRSREGVPAGQLPTSLDVRTTGISVAREGT